MPRKKELTPRKIEKYLKHGSGSCPRCGSISIEGGSFDMDGTEVSQRIICDDCGLFWWDTYRLSRIDVKPES